MVTAFMFLRLTCGAEKHKTSEVAPGFWGRRPENRKKKKKQYRSSETSLRQRTFDERACVYHDERCGRRWVYDLILNRRWDFNIGSNQQLFESCQ